MGKQGGMRKKEVGGKLGDSSLRNNKVGDNSSLGAYDKDTEVFISLSQELKDEGKRLLQKKDYEGAMLTFEKAIKLLPRNHIDVSYLRTSMAACYMEMGLSEYPRAIEECNLALEVSPKYSKALLRRARCYEALNRPDFALRDVTLVLKMEPSNVMATEVAERVKIIMEKGIEKNDVLANFIPVPEYVDPSASHSLSRTSKEKARKKKGNKPEEKNIDGKTEENKAEDSFEGSIAGENIDGISGVDEGEKDPEEKLVMEERINSIAEEPKKTIKLVFGEDIRFAQVPANCSVVKLREVIGDRFPSLKAVLIKYRDHEGDLVTITTDEELRWAQGSAEHGSVRLYIVEVNPEQDPFFEKVKSEEYLCKVGIKQNGITENEHGEKSNEMGKIPSCIDDWIIQFAQLFRNNVGFDSDVYFDLHELGMKVYSEAIEETVTSEEAQLLFETAAQKFQEMAALALFNWGNVHMSRARKRVYITEDVAEESVLAKVKSAYDWAQKEYSKAGKRYEEALTIKSDFYEGYLALGQQQFEKAKLSWYYVLSTKADLEKWPPKDVLQLYNDAEDNMEKGMLIWEQAEKEQLAEQFQPHKNLLHEMGLDGAFKDLSSEETAEQAAKMRSQINLLWGTMLYERSIMEFKLGFPVWLESLEFAVEKFCLAGVSSGDINVMIKHHCSNDTSLEGLGFSIDEMVQAWNEVNEVKRWQCGVPTFRLEPLLRRVRSMLHHLPNPNFFIPSAQFASGVVRALAMFLKKPKKFALIWFVAMVLMVELSQ